jgi:hypothetical protein
MSKTITNPTLAALRALMTAPPPAPVKSTPARTSRAVSREIEIKARRDPFNRAEHVRVPYLGPAPKTPASAAKLRREAMLMCPCRYCALALYPPTTFAEYAALGLTEPSLTAVREWQDALAGALEAPRPLTYGSHLHLVSLEGEAS